MQHLVSQISASAGDIVEVSLDRQANVRLLDPSNYRRYQNLQQYQGYGGLAVQSPARVQVPYAGTWFVVIDLGGASGAIRHSVRVIH